MPDGAGLFTSAEVESSFVRCVDDIVRTQRNANNVTVNHCSKSLILVDYMPVVKYINNTPCYAYLCNDSAYPTELLGDWQACVVYKKGPFSRNPEYKAEGEHENFETLGRFLLEHIGLHILNKWVYEHGLDVKNVNTSMVVTQYSGAMQFKELNALLLISQEFSYLRHYKPSEFSTGIDLFGYKFDSTLQSKIISDQRLAVLQPSQWLLLCLQDYLIDANLELGDYFVRFGRISISNRYKKLAVLTEFVPVILKFSDVENPIANLFPEIRDKFPSFAEAVCDEIYNSVGMNDLPAVTNAFTSGNVPTYSVESRYSICMSRAFMFQATRINPQGTGTSSMYSFRLFSMIIYKAIMQRLGLDCFWVPNKPAYVVVSTEDRLSGTMASVVSVSYRRPVSLQDGLSLIDATEQGVANMRRVLQVIQSDSLPINQLRSTLEYRALTPEQLSLVKEVTADD